jgi:hypothetical protein
MNERWNFETEGYAVIRSFFGPAELDTVVNAVGDVLASPSDPSMNRTGNELFPLRWNDPIAATSLQATSSMSALRDATDVRNLGWISRYVSTKCGRSPALGWHQDWWCWDHPASFQRQATQIAVLCHLSDTTKKTVLFFFESFRDHTTLTRPPIVSYQRRTVSRHVCCLLTIPL